MRRVAPVVFLIIALMMLWRTAGSTNQREASVVLYDPNPSHLWNRLYAALLIRQDKHGSLYGEDALDPLLWPETEHLLAQPSHRLAIQVLDEFQRVHGETLIHDPVKKAMLQRDLWAVFDWTVQQLPARDRPSYEDEKRALQIRLAAVLRSLALNADEIKALPDNYGQAVASGAFAREFDATHPERAFLPPDLFDPHGPWVCVQSSPESSSGVTSLHIFNVSGRSGFLVLMRLPDGRKATMDYLQSLWNFPAPYVPGPNIASDQAYVNPDLPSFPSGTEVALVRRMTVFDNQGDLVASNITESVQIRVYRSITPAEERNFGSGNMAEVVRNSGQSFYETLLSRALLFSGKNGGLRPIGSEERAFSTFQTMGDDPFEDTQDNNALRQQASVELQRCIWCHSGGGVRSLNSRESLLRPNRMQKEPENPVYGAMYWGDAAAIAWKQSRFDWGLLNGYWKAAAQ